MSSVPPTPFTARPAAGAVDTALAAMWQHQQAGRFTDVNVKVKETQIPAHKIILAANCPYLAKLLADADVKEVSVDEVEPEIMLKCIQYIYAQAVTFDTEALEQVLSAVNKLRLDSLQSQIVDYIGENTQIDACLKWWKLGLKYGMEKLRATAVKLMNKDMRNFSALQEFKELNQGEILTFVEDENRSADILDDVLLALVEWVDFDTLSRKDVMLEIFKKLKLDNCSTETLKTVSKKYQDLLRNIGVLELLLRELLERCGNGIRSSQPVYKTKPQKILIVGGISGKTLNMECRESDSFFGWNTFSSIPVNNPRSCLVVSARDKVFVFHNVVEETRLPNKVFYNVVTKTRLAKTEYNVSSRKWIGTQYLESDLPLAAASAINFGDCVYFFLGVSVYSTTGGYGSQLNSKPDMLIKQDAFPIVGSLDSVIYVVYNSCNGVVSPCTLQALDTTTAKPSWQVKAHVPTINTHGASLVDVGKELYLVGGEHQMAARYTPATDTWTTLRPPPQVHAFGSAVCYGGKILLFGGSSSSDFAMRIMSVYDVDNQTWETRASNFPLKSLRHFLAVLIDF